MGKWGGKARREELPSRRREVVGVVRRIGMGRAGMVGVMGVVGGGDCGMTEKGGIGDGGCGGEDGDCADGERLGRF